MKSLLAFLKKEVTEQIRTGRVIILGSLFVLFGIMNPAVAKLTPWMLDLMGDALEQSGMVITSVTVSALDSWMQFFKNIPMALMVFVLMESNIFTKEYQSGTLVLSLTKGLTRYKVVVAKTVVLTVLWTYGCNAYFWDNGIAQNLMFSVVCWWVFGLWVIMLSVFFSTFFRANIGVLAGTGSVVLAAYLLGLLPVCKEYVPTLLADGTSLIYAMAEAKSYICALVIAVVMTILFFAISISSFNKKDL